MISQDIPYTLLLIRSSITDVIPISQVIRCCPARAQLFSGPGMRRQQVLVRLTMHQALRMVRLGESLWPTEKLSVGLILVRAPASGFLILWG